MKKHVLALSMSCAMIMMGCAKKTTADVVTGVSTNNSNSTKSNRTGSSAKPHTTTASTISGTSKATRPARLVYKMNGDYANLVPVTLDNNGNIYSYPDPVDINEHVKPVALGNGWYLDRRGINAQTAFLDYTYEQYHALPKVPSTEELKSHIIARNAITDIWNCGTSQRTIEQYKQLVADGFPQCTRVTTTK